MLPNFGPLDSSDATRKPPEKLEDLLITPDDAGRQIGRRVAHRPTHSGRKVRRENVSETRKFIFRNGRN